MHILPALVTLLAVGGPTGLQNEALSDLPDIGDPAAAGLPLSQEKRLGPIIVRRLRSQLPVVEDIEINEYLSALGRRLVSANADNQLDFSFLLIDKPQINAFATPGGVVAINSGLMLAADSESELAGVLAHEIAHVTQRHLARLISESEKTSWAGYLTMIGAVLAAVYDSRLAQIGTQIGTALPIERTLGYSRAFEREADRLGMQLMTAADYDPGGMPRFFTRLQSQERKGGNTPEFLRTHPLTVSRLSDALNRAALMQNRYRDDSREFMLARARLRALTDPQSALSYKAATKEPAAVTRYRQAIALMRTNRAREATRLLENIPQNRERLATGLALAEAQLAQGNPQAAVALLETLNTLYPERESITYHLSDALLRVNRPGGALAKLRASTQRPHMPVLDKLAAKAAAASGKAWLSHKHLADYYQANGRMRAAIDQLELAEKDPRIRPATRKLIRTERKRIEKLQNKMEKQE